MSFVQFEPVNAASPLLRVRGARVPRQPSNKRKSVRGVAFEDVLDLVVGRSMVRALEVGCGSGSRTKILSQMLPGSYVLGIDECQDLIRDAISTYTTENDAIEEEDVGFKREVLEFACSSLWDLPQKSKFDVIVSNENVDCIPDHASMLERMASLLRVGGQMCLQIQANHECGPLHQLAKQIAHQPEFVNVYGDIDVSQNVLSVEQYKDILGSRLRLGNVMVTERSYRIGFNTIDSLLEYVRTVVLRPYWLAVPNEMFELLAWRVSELVSQTFEDTLNREGWVSLPMHCVLISALNLA
eukprot:ANDGO_06636.mRNA.1 Trans-aconitate 2-methyltransferase